MNNNLEHNNTLSIEEKKHLTKEVSRLFGEFYDDKREVWLINEKHILIDDRSEEILKELDIVTDVNPEFCITLFEHELLKRGVTESELGL